MKMKSLSGHQRTTRRSFLRTSVALGGTAALGPLALQSRVHAAGSDVIRIGLIGCGGRGTEAAVNAMNAGKDIRLVAMADLFDERLKASRAQLQKTKPDQFAVKDDHCCIGFDAYEKLLARDVDVVLIAPTSHFIPTILKAVVDAGKHVFCEKPHGIDIPGLKISMAACETAKQKGLALVSGLCWPTTPGCARR
jgi:myo-inositol 2-dehydrogenase/D-chiro-inositol 1-dehydrogenase